MKPVIVQYWEESERGWGVRPDGMTIHLSNEALKAYIDAMRLAWQEKKTRSYTRPSSPPFIHMISDEKYECLCSRDGAVADFAHQDLEKAIASLPVVAKTTRLASEKITY